MNHNSRLGSILNLLLMICCYGLGPVSDDPLSSELVREQKDRGLSLVSVFAGRVYSVDFSTRSLGVAEDHQIEGNSEFGIVSPDATLIALVNNTNLNLRISMLDGSGSQNYTELKSPSGMCWSNNNAKLALTANHARTDGQTPITFQIMDLESRKTEIVDDMNAFAMPQCWSPDGTLLVYSKNSVPNKQTVLTFNTQTKKKTELAAGAYATWIPTTDWITFLDCGVEGHDCTFYAIHPDGTGKRALFKTFAAITGLSWSPDGRFGAYVSATRTSEREEASWRLRVRRLQDNAEDWVANLTDTDPNEFQWTTDKGLLPQSTTK